MSAFLPSKPFSFDILPAETIQRLQAIADHRGITVGQIIWNLVDPESRAK